MLHRFKRFFVYFRWPLILGAVLAACLYFMYEPRPVAEYCLPAPQKVVKGDLWKVTVSPSGRFATLAFFPASQFGVFDLEEQRMLFQWESRSNSYQFDKNDELCFADRNSYWRWKPGEASPRKIGNGQWNNNLFGETLDETDIFSPDCSLCLCRKYPKDVITFEIMDTRTGEIVSRLDMPPIPQRNLLSGLIAKFSQDSSKLFVQTWPDSRPSNYERRLFDVRTGKAQNFDPGPWFTEVLFREDGTLIGIDFENDHLYLNTYSADGKYQRILLKETIHEPFEMTEDQSIIVVQTMPNYGSKVSEGKITYCWEYHPYPKVGFFSGGAMYLPEFHYAVREVGTGKLIHTGKLTYSKPGPYPQTGTRAEIDEYWEQISDDARWRLVDHLPHQTLLMRCPRQRFSPWQKNYEEWREKHASWLPSWFQNYPRFQFLHATTGRIVGQITLPKDTSSRDLPAFHQPAQSALYFATAREETVTILKYAFPLKKPWGRILGWSLCVLMILILVQYVLALRTKRKLSGSNERK